MKPSEEVTCGKKTRTAAFPRNVMLDEFRKGVMFPADKVPLDKGVAVNRPQGSRSMSQLT